jgi:hypothetical protein
MKLSTDTINILKNFATINSNLRIHAGSELSTIGPGKDVFARASITETFPREFNIYDLNSFLALITLMEDQDVDFGDQSLSVSKDGGKFEYFYAQPDVIIAPEAGKNIPVEPHFTFDMSKADIEMLNKAAGIASAKHIVLKSVGGKVTISVGDPKTANSNNYTRTVGESEHAFNCLMPVERLKVVADGYRVTLSKLKFLHFKHATKPLAYWLALDPESQV